VILKSWPAGGAWLETGLWAVADLDQSVRRGIVFQVLTIRCTHKLLERLRAEARREPTCPTNRLRDWYAHLVSTKRGALVICVSERALLPAFVAATRDPSSFIFAFQEAVQSSYGRSELRQNWWRAKRGERSRL
jgi:hypothetical protein